jgi:hypothetical protein
VLDRPVTLGRQGGGGGRVVALLLRLGGISGFWMPWIGVTVCPVGNGIAAPLVTVLTERWITGAAAGAPVALAALRRAWRRPSFGG